LNRRASVIHLHAWKKGRNPEPQTNKNITSSSLTP
jgi:hypothetical protein